MDLLKGKVAIVTGSSRGNGKAIALAISREGGNPVVTSRNFGEAKAVADEISSRYSGDPLPVQADVGVQAEVEKLFREASRKYDSVDILINNAGYPLVDDVWNKPFHEVVDDEYRKVLEVDLLGSMRCVRAALPIMMRQKSGVIINVSSTPALAGYDKGAPYTIAKAGLIGLTKHVAYEYGRFNIRCNTIALGNIKTPRTFDSISEAQKKSMADESPMGRWGEPGDVAGVCVLLASENSRFINGQTIVVDGGTVMR